MTDFRALCTELINELHGYKVAHPNHDTEVIDRARAAYYGELGIENGLVKVWNGTRWVELPFEPTAEQLLAAWDTPEYESLSNEDVVANLRRVLKLMGR